MHWPARRVSAKSLKPLPAGRDLERGTTVLSLFFFAERNERSRKKIEVMLRKVSIVVGRQAIK